MVALQTQFRNWNGQKTSGGLFIENYLGLTSYMKTPRPIGLGVFTPETTHSGCVEGEAQHIIIKSESYISKQIQHVKV